MFFYDPAELRKKIIIAAVAVLGIFAVFGIAINLAHKPEKEPESPTNVATVGEGPQVEPEKSEPATAELKATIPSSLSGPTSPLYDVVSITDGDTIKVNYGGTVTPVRLIGVNTPETKDPRKPVECFGQEASDYLAKLLTGKKVALETDPSQTDRDKYNRLLRYVYLDGEDVGYQIIKNGYGYEYTYNYPHKYQQDYIAAQKYAEDNNIGLWAPDTCGEAKVEPDLTSVNTVNNNTSYSTVNKTDENASEQSQATTEPKAAEPQSIPYVKPDSCLHYEEGRCWDELEDEAYSAGLYDARYGYYGGSYIEDDDCDAVCQDILIDAYEEGYYDSY